MANIDLIIIGFLNLLSDGLEVARALTTIMHKTSLVGPVF